MRRGDLKECQKRCSGLAVADGWVGNLDGAMRWTGAAMVLEESDRWWPWP